MANKKARGIRAKTRKTLSKKGSKATVNTHLKEFPVNSRVVITIDPSIHSGIPFRRYHGAAGTILRKQGRVFWVKTKRMNKAVEMLVHPAHLKAVKVVE
ncbi:MAG TPA: 50S ribosomal protein L21e [archaeon]|nr:50S ribosomal protein L21e [archaeon]